MDETIRVGDDVLIRLRDGADYRTFDSYWRTGIVTGLGFVLDGVPVFVELNDGGTRIYAAHIWFVSILGHRVSHVGGE